MLVGCTWHLDGVDVGGDRNGGNGGVPVADAGAIDGAAFDDLGPRAGDVDAGPPPVASCYSEDFSPGVSVADVAASYAPQAWKAALLTTLGRRIPGGHALVAAMQNDPQLGNFADAGSFASLMSSSSMVCNGETSVYDWAHATPSAFALWMRPDLIAQPPIVPTFPRSELAAYITDAATRTYDGALAGQPGQQDLTAVVDDLTAFTNGLGCVTAVADAVDHAQSARDGMAASLYYLELYLKRARTAHPSAYAALQASPAWHKVVRYGWARAAFWRKQATAATLGIADAPIWAHVDDAANSAEIEAFTGAKLSDIECHP